MAAITSIMRAHQILLAEVDAVVKPYGLTFARYEALVLLTFSKAGELPMSKIGERLMVHPTSVTNTVDRLGSPASSTSGPTRTTGAAPSPPSPTRAARSCEAATRDLMAMDFGLGAYDAEECAEIFAMLRPLRVAAQDFDGGVAGRRGREAEARPAKIAAGTAGYARPHEEERADPLPGDGLRHRRDAAGLCTVHRSQVRLRRAATDVTLVVSQIHGVLFIIYLVFAFDLGSKAKWPFGKLLWVLVSGTIPPPPSSSSARSAARSRRWSRTATRRPPRRNDCRLTRPAAAGSPGGLPSTFTRTS